MIYVITHKKFDADLDEHYKILHVGLNNNCSPEYLRDDTGINIANKNPNFCELTGLYWIWKNDTFDLDEITGIVHYRRYFTTEKEYFQYTYFNRMPHILAYDSITKAVSVNDIILPKKKKAVRTTREVYAFQHLEEDVDLLRNSIPTVCPEYLSSFDQAMSAREYYYGNMMICRKRLLDQYCEWMFPVLFELEKHIDLNKYRDNYQKRVYGFLSERMVKVFVDHNNLSVKEYPVFNTEERDETIFKYNAERLKRLMKK